MPKITQEDIDENIIANWKYNSEKENGKERKND